MKTLLVVAAAAIALAATPALAREPALLFEVVNQPITTSSGRPPSVEQIRAAIVTAASERRWILADLPHGGGFMATLLVRRHTVVVDVSYTATAFSITYRDSMNMGYRARGARQYIHPNYNRWTRDLADAIRLELVRL